MNGVNRWGRALGALASTVLALGLLADTAGAATTLLGSAPFGSSQRVRQLAVNPSTNQVYAAGYFADPGLTVLDASTPSLPAVVTTIPASKGGVTVDTARNHFFTSDGYGSHILSYDGATNLPIHTIAGGAGCGGLFDFDPATSLVYEITQCADSINVVDAATDSVVASKANCCAVAEMLRVNSATGRVYGSTYSATSQVFGPSPSFASLGTLPGTVVAADPSTNELYSWSQTSGDTSLTVLGGVSHSAVATVAGGVGPGGVYEPGGVDTSLNLIYVLDRAAGRLIVIDGATHTLRPSITLPGANPANAVAVDSVKHRVYAVGGAYDGAKTLYVYATDTTAPTVTIDSGPASPTASGSASFTFHATDPDDSTFTYECQLDGGGFAACTSPDNRTVSEGQHTFQVRARDPAGNVSNTASWTWGVDQTSPTATITTPADGQAYYLDQSVPAAYSCSDPAAGTPVAFASGIASCVAVVSYNGGAPTAVSGNLPTDRTGPYSFSVTATDNVGHTTTAGPYYYRVDPANYQTFTSGLSPLAYYRLDESRGSRTMADSSGNGNAGTYQNNVRLKRSSALNCETTASFTRPCQTYGDWWGGTTTGTSAYFNGRSNSGAHAYVNGITLPYQHYTLEAWVNPAEAGDMAILQHGSGGALLIQGGSFVFNPSSNNSSPVISTPVSSYSANHGWYFLAGVVDGSNASFYVNGAPAGSTGGVSGLSASASTFYVGLANLGVPTFHGLIDEVGYFPSALAADDVADQWEIGTYNSFAYVPNWPTGTHDLTAPNITNFEPYDGAALSADSSHRAQGEVFTFTTSDEDDPGAVTCKASIDGGGSFTLTSGMAIPAAGLTPGAHTVAVTCTDGHGNATNRTYHYTYGHFSGVVLNDTPLAYWRLGDAPTSSVMADSSPNGNPGTYKNDQGNFAAGIAGDPDSSRQFLGQGGYAYVNGMSAPTEGFTLEQWVALKDTGDQSIAEHGGAGAIFVRGGQFVFRPNANVAAEVLAPAAGACAPFANGSPLPASPRFQQIDVTWDGVNAAIYVDGSLCGSAAELSQPPFASGAATYYLGFGSQVPWLRGALDEASYYPAALTADQVNFHHLADPPGHTAASTPAAGQGAGYAGSTPPGSGTTGRGSTAGPGAAAPASRARPSAAYARRHPHPARSFAHHRGRSRKRHGHGARRSSHRHH